MRCGVKDIPTNETFIKIKPIHKGWSRDKKYYVETKDGERLVLRNSAISEYEEKKKEFEIMKWLSYTGIRMYLPIHFGIF